MASVVQICNMALTRIGQNQFIDSIDEQSKAAELCALHYEQCRDEVLQAFPWPFAEARVALADIGSPPQNWAFRYRYPVNCLQARRISVPGLEMPTAEQRVPFKVVNAAGGRAILSNQEQAELVYTVRVEDTTYFPQMFVNALAWRLAAELAMGLQARPENYSSAMQNYQMTISQAQALAFEESEEGPVPESEFIQARN
ncbi:hypothetical protein AUR59_020105 [Stutzerimonas balearica]|uniref:hypothetical protein n=1 Tax=Stutzerimonas balearica TaxID=74829 RepID=UPI00097122C8|nr:hypothetical protein [Stutzerimonas balearica]OMG61467.1 hypothetical protein AUR59_020105 [Stutzerimonas balearica]